MPAGRAEIAESATTRRSTLSAGEWVTTAIAALVSTGAYLGVGSPCLARGVVGDLLGPAVLGVVGVAAHARVTHEAAVCLALIGLVGLAGPQWPLALSEGAWWTVPFMGLAVDIAVRRRICD